MALTKSDKAVLEESASTVLGIASGLSGNRKYKLEQTGSALQQLADGIKADDVDPSTPPTPPDERESPAAMRVKRGDA